MVFAQVVDNPRWVAPEILKQLGYNEKSDVYDCVAAIAVANHSRPTSCVTVCL